MTKEKRVFEARWIVSGEYKMLKSAASNTYGLRDTYMKRISPEDDFAAPRGEIEVQSLTDLCELLRAIPADKLQNCELSVQADGEYLEARATLIGPSVPFPEKFRHHDLVMLLDEAKLTTEFGGRIDRAIKALQGQDE